MKINSGTATAHHFGAMVDFYPFGNTWFAGGWRLSGGYMTGKMNLNAQLSGELSGLPTDKFEFTLENQKYRYTGNTMNGKANLDWNYAGPYLGTGFDLGLFWGIKIFMDAGVVFTSKTAAVGLDVPLDNLQHWNGSGWDNVTPGSAIEDQLNNVKAATLKDANDTLADIKYYPMVKLGFMYRF
jgi:hypothetical protein